MLLMTMPIETSLNITLQTGRFSRLTFPFKRTWSDGPFKDLSDLNRSLYCTVSYLIRK
jgi:hypothetical protein